MGDTISTPHNSFTGTETNERISRFSKDASVRPLANTRIIRDVCLIWLDATFDEKNNRDCQKNIAQLHRIIHTIQAFTDVDQCVIFLSEIKDKKACVIISGSLGQQTLPRIHDISRIDSIFIFCRNIF